jgi:hypothetical protein
MLKIRQAGGAPDVMIAMIPDDVKVTAPDMTHIEAGRNPQSRMGTQASNSLTEMKQAFTNELQQQYQQNQEMQEKQDKTGGEPEQQQQQNGCGWRRGQQEGGRWGQGWRGRGGRGGCGMRGGGFMGMMKNFMNKMGGEQNCKQMKHEFVNTMQNGTEEQKKQQCEKMGEMMKKFGEHFGKEMGGQGQAGPNPF